MDPVDKTGVCRTCGHDIEHFAGIPGTVWHTPYWRHVETSVASHPHPAVPIPDSIQEVQR